MRITGGTALNRKLKTPGSGTRKIIRPTSDRVREALFSMLHGHVTGARILDLFAGTGSLGIEALSRGASSVVFVDRDALALELVGANLRACFKKADVEILRLDLTKEKAYEALHRQTTGPGSFDIIFLDPPYEKKLAEMALTMVEKTGLLTPGGHAVAEERSCCRLPEKIGLLQLQQERSYGETGIWIYRSEYKQEATSGNHRNHV